MTTYVTQEVRLDVLAALRAIHHHDEDALKAIITHTPSPLALVVQGLRLAELLAAQWVGADNVDELVDRLLREELADEVPS